MVSFVVWDHVRCYRQFSTKQERETRQSPRVETSEFRQGLLSVCHSRNKANSEQALDNCIIMLSLMNQKKYKCKFLLYRCNGENLLIFTYTHKTWLPKQGFHSKNYRTNNPCHRPVQQSLQTKKLNTSTKGKRNV
jgi:hypothetical protein